MSLKRVKVEPIIRSIIEKRNNLGWSHKKLADISKVPYSAIVRMEKGIGYWEDFALQVNLALDKAINSSQFAEIKHTIERTKFIPSANENVVTNTKPSRKRCGWSLHHGKCVKCGSSDNRHIARGLCKSCYDKDIEKRHKDNERIQNYGGSSKILTTEYLIENYINKNKSLADIAKETNCSRLLVAP